MSRLVINVFQNKIFGWKRVIKQRSVVALCINVVTLFIDGCYGHEAIHFVRLK